MDPVQSPRPDLDEPVASPQPAERDGHTLAVSGHGDPAPGDAPQVRPRGRHEAPRRFGPPGGIPTVAALVALVMLGGVLATRLMGSAEPAPPRPAGTTVAAATAAAESSPTTRPPGAGTSGNLIDNWSFEQGLTGWQVVGAAEAAREPQGRTSGSCASVRANGPQPARVGLRLPAAVKDARKGSRYVASAWVRSTAPGLRVTVRLAGAVPPAPASRTSAATLPGLAWRRVFVAYTAAATADLDLEVMADGVPAGDALLVDEVIVRQG